MKRAQQLNFNVASQSVDRLWATARDSTHDLADLPNGTLPATNRGPAKAHSIMLNQCPSFCLSSCGGKHFQFQINNTLYPNYLTDHPCKWFQLTKNALGEQGNMLSGCFPENVTHYRDFFFAFCQSLEHKTDGDERFMSGVDTCGAAASCYFKADADGPVHTFVRDAEGIADTDAAAAAANAGHLKNQTLVFAECTSSLKVYANKVLEVVQ